MTNCTRPHCGGSMFEDEDGPRCSLCGRSTALASDLPYVAGHKLLGAPRKIYVTPKRLVMAKG